MRQGTRALLAFTRPVDLQLAATYLNPEQMTLFKRLNRGEQLHSLNVLRDVLDQGETPHSLAVAALLHDVGKTRYPIAIWQKTLIVLIRAFVPQLFDNWSAGSPENYWQRAFVVSVQHPAWSAELVEPTGTEETAVWLIRHHADSLANWQNHPYYALLCRLRAADDKN